MMKKMKKNIVFLMTIIVSLSVWIVAACGDNETPPDDKVFSINPTSISFVTGKAESATIALINGGGFVIVGGDITADDYSVSDDMTTLSLTSQYQNSLSVGSHTLTITTDYGTATLTINVTSVVPPVIVPMEGSFDKHTPIDVAFEVALGDNEFSQISGNGIMPKDYTFSGTTLTIAKEYLSTLDVGTFEFKLVSTGGEATFGIVVSQTIPQPNDKPVANNKEIIKFPKESFSNEPLSALVDNTVGEIVSYDITVGETAEYGIFVCDETNGTFGFTPKDGWFGSFSFTYTATDSLGSTSDSATVTITAKQIVPTFGATEKLFIKGGVDLTQTVNTKGTETGVGFDYAVVSVSSDTALSNQQAQISGNTITFKAVYLDTLDIGTHTFSVRTEAGIGTFDVKVMDAVVKVVDYDNDLNLDIDVTSNINATSITGHDITSTDYTITDKTITFKKEFLTALSYGEYSFTAIDDNGAQDVIMLVLGGTPDVDTDQLVTKFTNEVITGERLRVTARVGELSYAIVTNTLPEHGTVTLTNNTFSFERTMGWWGETTFVYSATDSYGFSTNVTMTIEYKPQNPTIADFDSKKFNLSKDNETVDITYTVTSGLDNHARFSVEGNGITTDGYEFKEDKFFVIKGVYLKTLEVGVYTFTFKTSGGSAEFIVTVGKATDITQATAFYDKKTPADVAITVDAFGYDFVLKQNNEVVSADNYTFDDELNTLKLKSSYLNSLECGAITFVTSNGWADDNSFVVTISDTRAPTIEVKEYQHIIGGSDISVAINLYQATLTSITGLTKDEQYILGTNSVTLKSTYLDTLSGSNTLTFNFSDSTSISITINVSVGELPTVTVRAAFDPQAPSDMVADVDLKGTEFVNLSGEESLNLKSSDYTYLDSVLTINKNYLIRLHTLKQSSYTITLNTSISGKSCNFTIEYLNVANTIINGGFEAGTLFGWNSYSIWKGEEGMLAFTNDRVVNGKYFKNEFDYNREGDYNLGIHGNYIDGENWQGIDKNSGQERMGTLRSSDFTLGGSGWISFMLGGGKSKSFDYLSVMDVTSGLEIARFHNKNFNKAIDGTNTEARLFKYYFDLSEHKGKNLYFTINDRASNNWSVMSADSFMTYYAIAPTITDGELADNILPTIEKVGEATNEIIGGNSIKDMAGWNNVDNVFKADNNAIISNEGGDAVAGVLRSSTFKLGDNNLLKLGLGGGLKYDKQIFVSIFEVGTNREVMRLVRRDNLNGKASGDLDNHWYDLSQLDISKEYYLELCDNADSGDWAVIKAENVQLVQSEQGPDSDKAVEVFKPCRLDNSTGKILPDVGDISVYVSDTI